MTIRCSSDKTTDNPGHLPMDISEETWRLVSVEDGLNVEKSCEFLDQSMPTASSFKTLRENRESISVEDAFPVDLSFELLDLPMLSFSESKSRKVTSTPIVNHDSPDVSLLGKNAKDKRPHPVKKNFPITRNFRKMYENSEHTNTIIKKRLKR